MADSGGKFQPISAEFDRETEAFGFFRMFVSEIMTFEEVRETIIPTWTQKRYLLEEAKPVERKTLIKIFKARRETWEFFVQFTENKSVVVEFEKRYKKHRTQRAKRANRNARRKT